MEHALTLYRRFGLQLVNQRFLLGALAALPLALVVGLLGIILWVSFQEDVSQDLSGALTLRHYASLLGDPAVYQPLLNTLGFTLMAMGTALAFGIPAAWLVERTDLPGKDLVYTLMMLGVLVPGFVAAIGWVFLLHPRIGMINTLLMALLGLENAPFNIATIVGMGWVQGLSLASLTFIMTAATFRALNPVLEEAASVHGIGLWWSLIRVTVPLVYPGILAVAIYISTIAFGAFEVPAFIGLGNRIITFSTLVYLKIQPQEGLPQYGVAAALSALMLVIALLLSWGYFRMIRSSHAYAVVRGQDYRPKLIPIGRWSLVAWCFLGLYFLISKLLPLLTLLWAGMSPYLQPFSLDALRQLSPARFFQIPWDFVTRGALNTLVLMVAVPTMTLAMGLLISWVVVRSGLRSRFAFDVVAFLPHACPNMIFAIAAMLVALFMLPQAIPFYGTLFILLAVYVLNQISFHTRVLNSSLLQLHQELEEAAHVGGVGVFRTLQKVVLPLLRPAMLNAWLWGALLVYREVTMAAILVTRENVTLPTVIWGFWYGGDLSKAASTSLGFIVLLLPLFWLYSAVGRRRSMGWTQE
jgi:iron(III) transport system permease protein